jgi:glycerol-3-phosphate dehydrogenase
MDSSRVVREHEVETLACGLVSVMGGKWTTCRPMAEDTLTAVGRQLGRPLPKPEPMPLRGAAESLQATLDGLQRQSHQLEALLPDTPLRTAQVAHLQSTYGLDAVALIEPAEASQREPLSTVIPLCAAELDHAIQREHARSSSDVLARRCRLAMVDLHDAERLRPQVDALLDQAGVAAVSTSPISHQLNP